MAHGVADRDRRLPVRREGGPVPCDRRVEIQKALLHEQIGADREHALRAREHDGGGVVLPGPTRSGIGDASPHVDDPAALDVHGATSTEVVALDEIRDEGVHDRAVAILHEPMDPALIVERDCVSAPRHAGPRGRWRGHPLTEPWSSAEMT